VFRRCWGVRSVSFSVSVASLDELEDWLEDFEVIYGLNGAGDEGWDFADSVAMADAAKLSFGGEDDGLKMSALVASVSTVGEAGCAKEAARTGRGIVAVAVAVSGFASVLESPPTSRLVEDAEAEAGEDGSSLDLVEALLPNKPDEDLCCSMTGKL